VTSTFANPPASKPQPSTSEALRQAGNALRAGQFAAATRLAVAILAREPANFFAMDIIADAAHFQQQPSRSLQACDIALATPGCPPAFLVKKAKALARLRRRDEAATTLATLGRDHPDRHDLLFQAGIIYRQLNLLPEAVECLERSGPALGNPTPLLYQLGAAHFYLGQMEEAEQVLSRITGAGTDAAAAIYLRATLRRQTPADNHIDDIEGRIHADGFVEHDLGLMYMALAKELEDLSRLDESFAALEQGARLIRQSLDYDNSKECARLRRLAAPFSAGFMARSTPGHPASDTIFILGMPRSGTTLVERIITQSGQVVSAGEPKDFPRLMDEAVRQARAQSPQADFSQIVQDLDYEAIGRDYITGIRSNLPGSTRFIDKLPANFVNCGAIFKALPHARLVHLVRSPMDSCYAMYKTMFFGAYTYSFDQKELAEYFATYREVMAHWHQVMPGRILDVHYESLVENPEQEARRIYEWLDLPWTERALDTPDRSQAFVTASAAQVRQPIHKRSVGSAERLGDRLAVLRENLRAAGLL
jgi:tetratricopeptide (TPR) repeat protein